jgi:hypothetical protein
VLQHPRSLLLDPDTKAFQEVTAQLSSIFDGFLLRAMGVGT